MSIRDFVLELSSANAAPGGGSVAALCGALGAALSAMVSRLTRGREEFKDVWEIMEELRQSADDLAARFLTLVQEDTDAYLEVIAALRLPKETEEQKATQKTAIEESMKRSARVPLETLRASGKLIQIAQQAVQRGNPMGITDAGGAVHLARTAGAIAAYNVRINFSRIRDEKFVSEHNKEVNGTLKQMEALFAEVDGYVKNRL